MITPEWLSDELGYLQIHKELQESIIRDIVRRIMKTDFTVTDTAAWQAEKLQQSGMVFDEIISEVSRRTKKSESEIKKAFEDAQTEVFNYDDSEIESSGYSAKEFKKISPQMKRVIRAALSKTVTEAKNLTKTTAVTSQSAYIQACDLAHMQIASGAFTYQEAIKNAVRSAAIQGVNVIYPSGHKTSLDAAVRRAVLTGVNQTAGKLQEMRADEMDIDIMELSAHYGARPDHAEWQGQLVSRSGKSGYLSLDDIGYGRVDGFMGANCRHDWYLFFEGYSKRKYTAEQLEEYKNAKVTYNGEEIPVWQALDRQRAMERRVRSIKQQLVAFDEAGKNVFTNEERLQWKSEFDKLSVKLKTHEAALSDFCSQTGLTRDKFREQVFSTATENGLKNWGKSVSQKAVWANKRAVDNSVKSGIIKAEAVSTRFVNSNDNLYKNAKNIKPIDGFEDIVIHGNKTGFSYEDSNGNEFSYTVREFADILKNGDIYKGGNIRLISCETGSEGATAAQSLANQLSVNVLAPSDIVWVDENGSMTIGSAPSKNSGKWILFKPER